ncbi:LPS export ABC transporter periplasmic protein LptC [Rhodoligotrophos defluvii]|uniref:LPS export ABC transporter periplasmic protein LptC n=1 Tax=Rhodoligotrophos defluvii TaxID=2561934 RepID=UPI0010C9FBF5|nr:LPS export ABC transporter periplasmic protein LptC [Rhodoligotrophos defluvii]
MVMPTPHGANPAAQPGAREAVPHRRRTRFTPARIIMWGLTVVLVALVAAFVIQIGMFPSVYAPQVTEQPVQDPEVAVAREVQFTGFDRDGQPFSVQAQRAAQDKDRPFRVHLEAVKVEMKLKASGELLLVTARQGLYDDKAKTLDLAGQVHIVNSANYSANLQTARVFLSEKRLLSEDPVEVRFPDGTITAGGMEMRDDGQQVYFTRNVRTNFSQRSERDDAQPGPRP